MPCGRSAARCVLFAVLAAVNGLEASQDAPRRLSQSLLDNPPAAGSYLPGLSWRVPGEEPAQELLRYELLANLAEQPSLRNLASWVSTLPITGRVPLRATDPRWLATHRKYDPVLMPGQTVVAPPRPTSVTVITEDGDRC